jgi:antitoxin component YwqK of YwqJK toxin-antitoxin module
MRKPNFFAAFAILFSLLAMLSCQPNTTSKTENTGVYLLKYNVTADGKKEGAWNRYDSTGKVLYETANYRADSLEGEGKLFYPSGKVQDIRHYKNGHFVGDYKEFYESGTLKGEGIYTNSKMEGDWKRYYPNGQLQEVVTFKNGNENGAFKEFYENGKPKTEGTYTYNTAIERAQEDGILIKYDSLGNAKKMDCKMGRCVTVQ